MAEGAEVGSWRPDHLPTFWRPERPLSPSVTLCFMHVMRSGGSSFWHYLKQQFPPESYYGSDGNVRRTLLPLVAQPGCRLVRGHVPAPDLIAPFVQPLLVTMVREPLARVLSNVGYMRTRRPDFFPPNEPSRVHIEALRAASLDEFFLEPRFAGIACFYFNRMACQLLGQDPAPQTSACLAEAKRRLATFAFVGLTDQMALSLQLAAKTFQWQAPEESIRRNALMSIEPDEVFDRPQPVQSISPEARAFLSSKNQLDLELYHFASELFSQRIALAGLRVPTH